MKSSNKYSNKLPCFFQSLPQVFQCRGERIFYISCRQAELAGDLLRMKAIYPAEEVNLFSLFGELADRILQNFLCLVERNKVFCARLPDRIVVIKA